MKATVLLADSAQADPNGKVHALGLCWSVTGTPTPAHALVVLIEVAWDETNKKIPFHAELVDGDGNSVVIDSPVGQQPLQLDGVVEAGRPPGMPPGTAVRIPFCTQIGAGLNLVVGQRYEWRFSLNGESHEDWSASFTVVKQG
ncbi:Uncharacterised protein [Mycobacteroides abscessus subsp. abscessus]|uniref:hypothetical protein n=1 Tax=Mycobacteroides abscessus TaxID=36809 RepID=UPI00092941EC|nr:hypothetical protein [Mycobacteroides abscessus]SIJ34532.1 Uncharacterised protein [Mycobacteroides abscessus subsp. abscessus]SLF85917.1 Uncharacterised protein [Mycobacteroides abscessus subsp. abscessus]